MKNIELKLGILINTDINNKCYLNNFNILDTYKKIETNQYVKEISDSYEDIDNEINCFAEDAATIKSCDSDFGKTSFYLVCYAIDAAGEVIKTKIIKDLFY